MRSKAFAFLLSFSLALYSCKTYYIPIESFKSQFKNITPTTMKFTTTRGPLGGLYVYPANQIQFIECKDKEGNDFMLQNSPSIEIRFTDNDNKKTIFYFDGVYVTDSLVIGDRSRFIGLRKEIPLNSIKLIEVQDGHKSFKTANPK